MKFLTWILLWLVIIILFSKADISTFAKNNNSEQSVIKNNNIDKWSDQFDSTWLYPRTKELIEFKWHNYNTWQKIAKENWIKIEILACIAMSETDFGRKNTTTNNLWNVWNNDRGNRIHFLSVEEGIKSITVTLNNKYMTKKEHVDDLYPTDIESLWYKIRLQHGCSNTTPNVNSGCDKQTPIKYKYVYASWPNARKNMFKCLSMLNWKNIDLTKYPIRY